MRDLIIDIFGTYQPNTYEMITTDGAIDVIPNGLAGVDIPYIAGVILFGIFLYCTFRIIGGLIK